MSKSRREIVFIGQNALRELELGVTSKADMARIDKVRSALVALDEEHADAKGLLDGLSAAGASKTLELAERSVKAAATQLDWARTQLKHLTERAGGPR